MELGQRIKAARLEAGLSQRQLCGEVITRNMLSQIENGSARPSMDTLQYLAAQLGRPVSFFLEEDGAVSPNQALMTQARKLYAARDWSGLLAALEDYREPDAAFDGEKHLLQEMTRLAVAEQALAEGKLPYARYLLQQLPDGLYGSLLEQRHQLLLAQVQPGAAVPHVDDVLLLKAKRALDAENYDRAAACLDAADDQTVPKWQLLRGQVFFAQGRYRQAAAHFARAEEVYPAEVIPKLEQCYLHLEDYKMAYLYACKGRK
jgi:transcriptional regulator with XRE-family HTH domain